jgi:hypothetical protein
LAHHAKKKKLWRFPKIEGSILKSANSPLWPSYICQSIWDEPGVLLGILWGTCQEHGNLGNLNGTCWEKRKNEKNPFPPLPPRPKLKRKIVKTL